MTRLLALAAAAAALAYPAPPRGEVPDSPYQWMEDLDSPPVKKWVEDENALTFGYLDKLPQRDGIKKRLTELWDYARTAVPEREAGQLYYLHNTGLQRQSVLYRAPDVEVLDPNKLWPDGSVAMSEWKASPDGRWLVYSAAAGGSDLMDLHVRDLRKGADTGEVIARAKFSGVSFTRDSRGFLYERFKGTEQSVEFAKANTFHQVWYHRIGGAKDQLVYERPESPRDFVQGGVSDDGRWLFLISAGGTSNNRLFVKDLKDPKKPRLDAKVETVAADEDAIHRPLGVARGRIFLYTTFQAPNGRIVSAAIGDPDRAHWKTVVAETNDPIRESLLVRDRLVVARLHDVQSRIELFDLAGRPAGEVKLPEPGSVFSLQAKQDDPDFFFEFTSFLRPRTVYRYVLQTAALETFHPPKPPFDSSQYEARALFYPSKDGTRVPLFVALKKGTVLDHSHPAILTGYGGFDIAMQPVYSPAIAAWLDQGGVWALANLRGGNEYGEAWHHAGMREKKQNVFDDFIAAAEYLEKEGYSSAQHLAIRGGSNGGLLVGAVVNQRPDLFGVALPMVGVMDMMRYQKFTGGALWADEWGSSDDPKMAKVLLAYSPLHNVKPGVCHPATLVTTADRDDRVVPSHSFKYAAALQAAQGCTRPVLIRIETAGSHGYRPTDRVIAEIADQWAFALANL
ncbi:MAG: prolyl oligopeptidase family serine peptidase [Myxococcales bacterium]